MQIILYRLPGKKKAPRQSRGQGGLNTRAAETLIVFVVFQIAKCPQLKQDYPS